MAGQGARDPIPIFYESPVASAQLKSAVLLAGLAAPGETIVKSGPFQCAGPWAYNGPTISAPARAVLVLTP